MVNIRFVYHVISISNASNIIGGKMSRLKLILPSPKYEKEILEYKKEFLRNGDSMDGTAGLKDIETFNEWYELLCSNAKGETLMDGFVPATLYMAFSKEDMHLVGMIHIRHYLNNHLLNYGGNIGYSIRKSERQKGYAAEMLGLALEKCKELKLEKVLITCNKNNIASAKTMLKNGAQLENEILKGNDLIQRYWITLS
jgi:predicted acetyltransferase